MMFLSLLALIHLCLHGCSSLHLSWLLCFILSGISTAGLPFLTGFISLWFMPRGLSLLMLSMHFIMHQCVTENPKKKTTVVQACLSFQLNFLCCYFSSCFFSLMLDKYACEPVWVHIGVFLSLSTETSISKYTQIMGKHIFQALVLSLVLKLS